MRGVFFLLITNTHTFMFQYFSTVLSSLTCKGEKGKFCGFAKKMMPRGNKLSLKNSKR